MNIVELNVLRTTPTHYSTIGNLSIGETFFSYCLEPTDRGLTHDMTIDQIEALKIPKQTCIPNGRYEIKLYNSPKHGLCLCLQDVPGFGFVEIHIGNYPHDTEACLLPGAGKQKDMVTNSKSMVTTLNTKLFPLLKSGTKVFINYKRAYNLPINYV